MGVRYAFGQAVQGPGTAGASEDGAGNHLSTSPLWIPLGLVLSGSHGSERFMFPVGPMLLISRGMSHRKCPGPKEVGRGRRRIL
jgi:hypothetical protein